MSLTSAEAPVRIAPARAVAAHVLLLVERGTAHADDQMRTPRVEALTQVDRNLTNELVFGALRWQRVLDREIAARLRDPGMDMHLGVIVALRLGAYQLLFLDRIPSHAAVHESVELAKQADARAAGMVNAVLRRLQRERTGLTTLRNHAADAYPEWMVQRWRARFGDTATQAICAWGQQPVRSTLRLPRHAEHSADLQPGKLLKQAAYTGPTEQETSSKSTSVWMQDEGSQLVGEIAAFQGGASILDACAAPAGKTLILAERNPDASITAMDVSAARLRMAERRHAWGARVQFSPGDAALLAPVPAYDTILCDVPCSGTGTLARNPEIRHRLDPSDLSRQAERQRAILSAAFRALRPGGRLVYSTCSLEPEENEAVVDQALAANPAISILPVAPILEQMRDAGILTAEGYEQLQAAGTQGPYLRTVPGLQPCDGFFAAVLTRS